MYLPCSLLLHPWLSFLTQPPYFHWIIWLDTFYFPPLKVPSKTEDQYKLLSLTASCTLLSPCFVFQVHLVALSSICRLQFFPLRYMLQALLHQIMPILDIRTVLPNSITQVMWAIGLPLWSLKTLCWCSRSIMRHKVFAYLTIFSVNIGFQREIYTQFQKCYILSVQFQNL